MEHRDFALHIGQDYGLTYTVEGDTDYNGYTAILKIRERPDRKEIYAVNGVVEGNRITFRINGLDTAKIPRAKGVYMYDCFLFNDTHSQKLGYGKINIVRDISMH